MRRGHAGWTRRGLLGSAAGLALAGVAGGAAAADPALLPSPASLAAELARAQARHRALVVLVSTEGCPWCLLVRRSYLAPLVEEGQSVVEIDLQAGTPVVDFQGGASSQAQVARSLGIRVAPTVLFIGPGGRELAPRIAGVPLPDFYGAYLDERLAAANRALG
jgi:hypothetical protein